MILRELTRITTCDIHTRVRLRQDLNLHLRREWFSRPSRIPIPPRSRKISNRVAYHSMYNFLLFFICLKRFCMLNGHNTRLYDYDVYHRLVV